ncbi:L-threonine O-3-phosphate decarboxylase [Cognatiyoonia koreensis]|uniref:Aminotransferase n=1 Tax=Cognatiyoonia koreensis TaxID=364200 RepID=A0A1I0RCD8_9RHOB|nr:threonine-phosphate decarboxylase [Cognatiyoonia koreensis]SEW38506.1 L-threonine O-3-phosphate decarboxylase [Cognatiyoonia koreensis]
MKNTRDHGGGLDAAIAQFGGSRADWLDLSTGINPVPYPMPTLTADAWTALPDANGLKLLIDRARRFWNVPDDAEIIAAPGASSIIAQLPRLKAPGKVAIPGPTYNEHGAAFRAAGWTLDDNGMDALVAVHPNNPDGHLWDATVVQAPFTIIDESFCDVVPDATLIHHAARKGTVVLKSFGKFWGLAGLRLGFAIGDPDILAQLGETLGPWQVSGPASQIGAEALADLAWSDETRQRLAADARQLDTLLLKQGAHLVGGTDLFRLYEVDNAKAAQQQLARHHVWSRIFPYADNWLRLGLPHPDRWGQLEAAF